MCVCVVLAHSHSHLVGSALKDEFRRLAVLREGELRILVGVLSLVGIDGVMDVRNSVIPFICEFAAYLAHCEREGGLTLALRSAKEAKFALFFDELNSTIVESAFHHTGFRPSDTSFADALCAMQRACGGEEADEDAVAASPTGRSRSGDSVAGA